VEHTVETRKQDQLLLEFLTTNRGIAFNNMFAMTEYPRDILPLYAQGHSLARFLIAQGGKRKFVDYVGDGMKWNSWTKATQKHYGFWSLSELQVTWLDWVRHGSGPIAANNTLVAQASTTSNDDLIPVASTATPTRSRSQKAGDVVPVSFETQAAGWYARVRDGEQEQASSTTEPTSGAASSRSPGRSSQSGQTVSRPQPLSRAQQVILEWTRPSAAPRPLAPTPPAARQMMGPGKTQFSPTYLVSPQELRGTILR